MATAPSLSTTSVAARASLSRSGDRLVARLSCRARLAEASILGLPNERFVPTLPGGTDALRREFMQATDRQRRALCLANGVPRPALNILAILGGGYNGAFSAGLVCCWTDHGTRPDFHLVRRSAPAR
jgi:hypothetical protein